MTRIRWRRPSCLHMWFRYHRFFSVSSLAWHSISRDISKFSSITFRHVNSTFWSIMSISMESVTLHIGFVYWLQTVVTLMEYTSTYSFSLRITKSVTMLLMLVFVISMFFAFSYICFVRNQTIINCWQLQCLFILVLLVDLLFVNLQRALEFI